MPPKSQSLCLPPLAFLFIEVNLSLFNNNKKDWCSKGNTEIARIIFTLWIEGIQFSSSDCKITKAAVEQRKLPRLPVRLLPAAPPLDFMILFLLWSQLKSSDWEGFSYSGFLSSHKCCSLQHAILRGTIWRISLNYYGPFIMLGFNCWVWKPDKDQILNGVLRTETDTATLFIALILYPSFILML